MTIPTNVRKSHMELCIHLDGEPNRYLRVPTYWDERRKMWIGFTKTPKTQRLIHGEGKDSFELQKSFNGALTAILEHPGDFADEVWGMFKPMSYWEEMDV